MRLNREILNDVAASVTASSIFASEIGGKSDVGANLSP